MSSQVELRIPEWGYLRGEDREWLWNELKLATDGREEDFILLATQPKKTRKSNPYYVCARHLEGRTEVEPMPPETDRCDQCRNWATHYVLKTY